MTKHSIGGRIVAGLAALTAVCMLAACSNDAGGSGEAIGDSIVVASVNAITGSATFADSSAGAQAVFKRFNDAGGLDGKKIDYRIFDDKSDPSAASSGARDAVEGGAVAMVGAGSLIDCQINHSYYEQNDIVSIQGLGIDPFCFSTPNISSIIPGPYVDTALTLAYGTEVLGLEKVCGLIVVSGPTLPAYQEQIDWWKQVSGQDFAYLDDTLAYGTADYTPYLVKVKEAGCQALYFNSVEPDMLGLLKAAQAQGLDDLTFLFLTSAYSEQFAQAADFVGKGVYVPAELAPFTDPANEANADWRKLMTDEGVPLNSFSQAGYLAATHFIELIQGIDGDITRESVTAAAKAMTAGMDNPMAGDPWIFGPGDTHQSNTAGWPIVLKPGAKAWENAGDDWISKADFEK